MPRGKACMQENENLFLHSFAISYNCSSLYTNTSKIEISSVNKPDGTLRAWANAWEAIPLRVTPR